MSSILLMAMLVASTWGTGTVHTTGATVIDGTSDSDTTAVDPRCMAPATLPAGICRRK
jgi:hypothetical protein